MSDISSLLYPCPQALQRAELERLHRALAAAHRLRDLAVALPVDEAHVDDAPLVVGQPVDQLNQPRPLFDFNEAGLPGLPFGLRDIVQRRAAGRGAEGALVALTETVAVPLRGLYQAASRRQFSCAEHSHVHLHWLSLA